MEGSHTSRKGNKSDGTNVSVPLFRHHVALDYTRVELELLYTATAQWDIIARLPWERKAQSAGFTLVAPASPEQVAAMQRAIEIHHRTEVVTGVSDATLMGRRRFSSLLRTGDALALSAGVSLPIGSTIENPYHAGDHGIAHTHLQFGTGTFDPAFESSYSVPVFGAVSAGAFVAARLPLYENSKTFRSSPDATLSVSVMGPVHDRVSVRAAATSYVQGYGYWDGVRDVNMTGLLSTSAGLGASFRVGGIELSMDARYPIAQRTLSPGDAFKRGLTVIIGLSGRAR